MGLSMRKAPELLNSVPTTLTEPWKYPDQLFGEKPETAKPFSASPYTPIPWPVCRPKTPKPPKLEASFTPLTPAGYEPVPSVTSPETPVAFAPAEALRPYTPTPAPLVAELSPKMANTEGIPSWIDSPWMEAELSSEVVLAAVLPVPRMKGCPSFAPAIAVTISADAPALARAHRQVRARLFDISAFLP